MERTEEFIKAKNSNDLPMTKKNRSVSAGAVAFILLCGQLFSPLAVFADEDGGAPSDAPAADTSSSDSSSSDTSSDSSSDSSSSSSDQDTTTTQSTDSSDSGSSSETSESESTSDSTETTTDNSSHTDDSASSETHDDSDVHVEASSTVPAEDIGDGDAMTSGATSDDASSTDSDSSATGAASGDSDASTTDTSAGNTTQEAASTGGDSSSDSADASNTPSTTATVPTGSDAALTQTTTDGSYVAPTSTTTTTTLTTASTTIQTGNAYSIADILNLLNTNFVNSTGLIGFSNFLDNSGTIDTRGGTLFSSLCSLVLPCTRGDDVSLNFLNTASVDNQITLQAASGGNSIDTAPSGIINTGSAFAGLNLINLANTNFTDSNYFLLTLNAFKNVNGDIVLPSLANFFTTHTGSTPNSLNVNNDASLDNGVSATSDSGNNTIASATASTISTGSSLSYTNIFNQLNTNIGDDNLSVLFRIGGNWNGQVFDLPTGVSWTRTDDGILFSSTPNSPFATMGNGGSLSENATNTASIHNQVSVGAGTGQNSIQDTDAAAITTGDALSAANIVNVANTNIIGRNWMLAIINVFGDFNGDIAFGRPDLWIGDQIVDAPGNIQDGDELTYKISVHNAGDAEASASKIVTTPDTSHLTIEGASVPFDTNINGSISWQVGSLAPGASKDITFTALVHDAPVGTQVTTNSDISAHETDNNIQDNSDSVTFSTSEAGGSGYGIQNSTDKPVVPPTTKKGPILKIVRTPEFASPTGTSRTVHEVLTIENESTFAASGVVLDDIIRDPSGAVIDDEPWDIGAIKPGEEVQVEYDAAFADAAPAGTYVLSTEIKGNNVPDQGINDNGEITLTGDAAPVGEVLGASTTIPTAGIVTAQHKTASTKTNSVAGKVAGAFTTPTAYAADGSPVADTHSSRDILYFALAILIASGALALGNQYWTRRRQG